ncbi:hypothetical protein ACIQVL_48745 [Streptomyces sp. NPDC090499]|uniref:hypothetical protein n=1 Tax=Streptomyces sp. NPDC090499 TaxID=3365965 RepID=UPI00382C8CEF
MAMVFGEGDRRAGHLSEQATRLYGAIAGQEWELVDTLQAADPNARQELQAWGLISDEETPIARDPQQAIRTLVTQELAAALRHIELVATMPDLSRDLIREYRQVQLRASEASVYLADQAEVNARLRDVVGDARREILAAQPGGPRKREVLEDAVTRDRAALDRGVVLRTIYRDTVRDHPVTAEYARTMSTRAGGRPAQYRTLVGDFERMIIVDREVAFTSDHIVDDSPPHSAWLITDPAAVSVLAAVFDATWRRAQPWTGEVRPSRRSQARSAGTVRPDGVRTSREEREVMRMLCAGVPQSSTAKKVGVSKRKLEETIASLKALWGVRTLNELIYQYALSPDRLVDDSDTLPVTSAVTTEAAE